MITDIILALIAVIGPIISGVWSHKSAVRKSEIALEAVKEKSKGEIEAIKIQTNNELEKIREQALAEARLHEDKMKTDIAAKQFEHPMIQEKLGSALGSVMETLLEKELEKHYNKDD